MEILITSLRHLLFGYSNTIDTMMLDFWMVEERNGYKREENFQVLFILLILKEKETVWQLTNQIKSIRALYPYVIDNIWNKNDSRRVFIDARSNEEYNGKYYLLQNIH